VPLIEPQRVLKDNQANLKDKASAGQSVPVELSASSSSRTTLKIESQLKERTMTDHRVNYLRIALVLVGVTFIA
jgi:hypothetical protein